MFVHRDSDCLLPDEIRWYLAREAPKLPDRCKLFFTPLTDIEHQFCQPAHISGALNMPIADATALVEGLIDGNAAKLAMEFSQKRADLKSKILRDKDNVPSATDLVQQRVSFEQVKGKRLWGLLSTALIAQQQNPMYLLTTKTDALRIEKLAKSAALAWPPQPQPQVPRPTAASEPFVIIGNAAEPIVAEEAPAVTPAVDAGGDRRLS